MQLTIKGETHTLMPIRAFRDQFDLPESFGVNHFEPKDYTGLASIEHAAHQLNDVRESVLIALPEACPITEMLGLADLLTGVFLESLERINPAVGLKPEEIDFAVNGFRGVVEAVAVALVWATARDESPPPFEAIYGRWLNESTRISATDHMYPHESGDFIVRIINTVYGRAGLMVQTRDAAYYVRDGSLACPAEGFMGALLGDVAAHLYRLAA